MTRVALTILAACVSALASGSARAQQTEDVDAVERLEQILQPPGPEADPQAVRTHLDQVIAAATALETSSSPGPQQLTALNVQMQGLYLRANQDPLSGETDRTLLRLRTAARRTKAMDQPDAAALGDYWLTAADLLDINRSGLSLDERRTQTTQLLRDYLRLHPQGPASDAVRAALDELSNSFAAKLRQIELPASPPYQLRPMVDRGDGVVRYSITCAYQPTANELRILLPLKLAGHAARTPVSQDVQFLFVLPVEAGREDRYGDGLAAVQQLDLHNRYHLIVIAPTFSQLPWYADHPSDPAVRQESYMVQAVTAAVDDLYPHPQPRRLLLGFSKSGWGAMSLLLRHDELFAAAAAWDAPLMIDAPTRYGMQPIFGAADQFRMYFLPDQARRHVDLLRDRPRLVLHGHGNFHDDLSRMHELLTELNVPHEYANDTQRPHHWDGGWIEDLVTALLRLPR